MIKGFRMMEFCYINLLLVEDKITLMKGTIGEKIKYYLLKQRIKSYIKNIYFVIKEKKCSDIDIIVEKIKSKDDDSWDILLYISIIRVICFSITHKQQLNKNDLMNQTLKNFFLEIQKKHTLNSELLNLEIELLKIKAKFDLVHATV